MTMPCLSLITVTNSTRFARISLGEEGQPALAVILVVGVWEVLGTSNQC